MSQAEWVWPKIAAPRGAVLGVALVAWVGCALGLLYQPEGAYAAYLFAWLFFLGISVGCMAWAMVQNLMLAGWGRSIQRICEAAALNLPLMALLFVPVVLGLKHLYPWARPELVARYAVLQHRGGYMNATAFSVRAVVYLAIWSVMAVALAWNSRTYDRTASPAAARRLAVISAPGIAIYVVTMTLASVDWLMSREVSWYSTIFGFLVAAGQSLSGVAFAVLVLTVLTVRSPLRHHVTREIFVDLGNLMLTSVILWIYMEFMQYLVLWMGNVRADNLWYAQRTLGGWMWISLALFVFGFLAPFFMLLMRDIKGRPGRLAIAASLVLAMRIVWVWWMVIPSGENPAPPLEVHWMVPVSFLAVGGLWVWLFLGTLSRMPLLPVLVKRQEEIAQHGTGELTTSG